MNFGWCVSGQGMAMRAVVEAHERGLLESRIEVVVVDRPSPVQTFCEAHKIGCFHVDPAELSRRLIELRTEYDLDWLGLSFNRLLKSDVIEAFDGKILNMHFSLLPNFPGFHPTAQALTSGAKIAGVTLHLIDTGIDTGPIVAQAACPVLTDDTVASLGKRQFDCAVPLVLQTIRAIERRDLQVLNATPEWRERFVRKEPSPKDIRIDDDLSSFAAEFCHALG